MEVNQHVAAWICSEAQSGNVLVMTGGSCGPPIRRRSTGMLTGPLPAAEIMLERTVSLLSAGLSYNGFANWFFFGGSGRSAESDPEEQEKAIKYSDVVANAMMFQNPDYLALHQAGTQHAGIAWCHATKHSIGEQIRLLVLQHAIMDRDAMRNHVEYL
jgi:hypothetical protein